MDFADQLEAKIKAMTERKPAGQKKELSQDLWKPTEKHDVRLFPYPHDPETPIVQRMFHFNIGAIKMLVCPASFGEQCEICDYLGYLKGWKRPNGVSKTKDEKEADWQRFMAVRKLEADARFFVPVVERIDGTELNAKLWMLSKKVFMEELSPIYQDKKRQAACGNPASKLDVILGVEKAFDLSITVTKTNAQNDGKSFTATKITGDLTPSKLADKKTVDRLKSQIKPIDEIFRRRTGDEVKQIFKEFMDGGAPVDSKPETSYPPNSTEDHATVGNRSVEAAIDDILNKRKVSAN